MQLLPGFSPSAPSAPPPLPPPPKRDDPAVKDAKDKLRKSERRRAASGFRGSILTTPSGDDDLGAGTTINRPQARAGSQMLGG